MGKFTSRYIEDAIKNICFSHGKMAFISGPRQCGKTTMAKNLLNERHTGKYYNWDETVFRRIWSKNPQDLIRNLITENNVKPLLVLDEIHKDKLWKRSVKGLYDTSDGKYDIIVTGSARLNVYRKGSDSLLGRYYHFRLHPFSLAESLPVKINIPHEDLLEHLFNITTAPNKLNQQYFDLLEKFGPFPEPLFTKDSKILNLWHRGHIEKIIREDLRDLSRLPELSQIEMLVALLPERVASTLSLRSLSEDLEVAYTTVKRWMSYLYELYYAFKIQPFSKSLPRSLKKESKMYLWDWSEIDNKAARFENMIAAHLLKYCDYLSDTGEGDFKLHYLRNKEQKEIDFLITKDKKPWLPVEIKLHDTKLSNNWSAFMKHLTCKYAVQVVKSPDVYTIETTNFGKVLIISAAQFLSCLV